jgi:hypothetical protein
MKIEIIFDPGKYPYRAEVKWHSSTDWNSTEAYLWCEKNFGHRNDKYENPRWYANIRYFTGNFRFRDKKDAEWFLLRWG